MNWIPFLILAYVAVAMQTGLSPLVRLGSADSIGAEPNFGLIVVVFIALYAQRQTALLAAFVMGALQDLATQQPFGLFAFSYGLAAVVIASGSRKVYRSHPLTHFFFALLGGFISALVLLLHSHLRHTPVGAVTTFSGAVYTAALAPLLIAGLQKARRLFAFRK
jgi:rod shape-determining protein MreD